MDKNFKQFVTDLSVPANFSAWGPMLALLDIGNFDGLVKFGGNLGYTFSVADIRAFLAARRGARGVSANAVRMDASPAGVGGSHPYLDAWASQ